VISTRRRNSAFLTGISGGLLQVSSERGTDAANRVEDIPSNEISLETKVIRGG
jgi:hypothetical protein